MKESFIYFPFGIPTVLVITVKLHCIATQPFTPLAYSQGAIVFAIAIEISQMVTIVIHGVIHNKQLDITKETIGNRNTIVHCERNFKLNFIVFVCASSFHQ